MAGLAALLVCLPMLLGLFGLARFGVKVLPSSAISEPEGKEEEYRFYHDQLRNLGFERLGVIEIIGYFFCFHYVKRFIHRVFVNRELGVYASIYQLIPGGELRVHLSTLLTDGWLVQTANCVESLVIHGEKYYRWGITTRIVREQLEAHQELLRSRWEEGDALAPIELVELAERMRETNRQSAGGWFAQGSQHSLFLALFFLGGPAALGLLIPGWRQLLIPGGLLLGSLAFHPLMPFLMRWAARSMHQEDVEKRQRSAGSEIESASRRFTLQDERAHQIQEHGHIRGKGAS
jgi:hypothetical protein